VEVGLAYAFDACFPSQTGFPFSSVMKAFAYETTTA